MSGEFGRIFCPSIYDSLPPYLGLFHFTQMSFGGFLLLALLDRASFLHLLVIDVKLKLEKASPNNSLYILKRGMQDKYNA